MSLKGLLGPMLFCAMLVPSTAFAHCDTLGGPVVSDARTALSKGDVTPVLKWVGEKDEQAVRDAFTKTMAVRGKGPEARELADAYFFETLVRIHRAGEGEPYTGLKPAGDVEPGIEMADKALETGSADDVVKELTGAVASGIKERFARASELRKHKDESVQAGREYVEAYVDYIHYVERIHSAATGPAGHHGAAEGHGH